MNLFHLLKEDFFFFSGFLFHQSEWTESLLFLDFGNLHLALFTFRRHFMEQKINGDLLIR